MSKRAQENSLDSSSNEDEFISLSLPPILPQPEHRNKHKKSQKHQMKSHQSEPYREYMQAVLALVIVQYANSHFQNFLRHA